MKKLTLLIVVAFVSTFAITLQNAQVKVMCDKTQSSITYSMNHPMHAWEGVSKDITSAIVTDEKHELIYQVAVSAKVASFDSQNANRDSHMIEVTEAIKYPTITFVSTSVSHEGEKLYVGGNLTFHGVTQKITFEAIRKNVAKGKIQITGNFIVKMSKFNIESPTLMGVATDDAIGIAFNVVY